MKIIGQNLPYREELRRTASKMKAGTKGLDEGFDPHMLDVSDILCTAWSKITVKTIARCWIKADILPREMHLLLRDEHGKVLNAKF